MGGFFNWGKSEDAAPRVDEHAQNVGADSHSAASNAGGVAAHTVSAARENALNLSASAGARRGRKPKDAQGNSGSDQRALQARIDAQIAAQLDAVHDPKAWGALLAAPGDVAVAITGREHWEISKDERETLGACGSTAARTLMITNPRSLALLMAASALFAVYMPRLMKEAAHLRKEKAKENAATDKAASN